MCYFSDFLNNNNDILLISISILFVIFFGVIIIIICLRCFFFSSSQTIDNMSSLSSGMEMSANDKLLLSLEKQLSIETKVKNGAENMIQSLTGGHGRDKKLLAEAQQMLSDSKTKIEFLKLRIRKVKQHRNSKQESIENGESGQPRSFEAPLEERIEELKLRLRIEAAVVDGAKNVIRILQSNKVPDKKALHEVSHVILLLT